MPDLLTTAQVAALLGISRDRVPRLARSRGVGRRVGRDWLFSPAEVAALRLRKPGRPRRANGMRGWYVDVAR